MNKLWCVLLVTLLAALLMPTASAAPATTATLVNAQPQVSARDLGIPFWIKNVAKRLLDRQVRVGEVTKEFAKEAVAEWVRSGAKVCPSYLPAPYFCPRKQTIWSRWGVGYALRWRGRVPGAWTSPTSPRRLVYAMTPGVPYWLTCYTRGDTVSDGGIVTSMWYRLRSGSYVNDGWFETGTNSVIPGVTHC